jgi:hypothetical protein
MQNKTFSDFLDEVAKEKGYNDFKDLTLGLTAISGVQYIATEAANLFADYCVEKAGENNAIKFTEWVFSECSMDAGHFPHELGFWHKETQKYLSLIDLYDLFEPLPKAPKP